MPAEHKYPAFARYKQSQRTPSPGDEWIGVFVNKTTVYLFGRPHDGALHTGQDIDDKNNWAWMCDCPTLPDIEEFSSRGGSVAFSVLCSVFFMGFDPMGIDVWLDEADDSIPSLVNTAYANLSAHQLRALIKEHYAIAEQIEHSFGGE